MLQTLPVLDELRSLFPKAQIDWALEESCSSLLQANPRLSNVLVMRTKKWRRSPFAHRREIAAFIKNLRQTHYDLLFDLQGNAKSALITMLARADCKIGFSFRSVREKINYFATNRHIFAPRTLDVRSRYLTVVRSFLGVTEGEKTACKTPKIREGATPTLMVCFGSNWKNKMLSKEQLNDLLQKVEDYCRPQFIFIYGNPEEEQTAKELEKKFLRSEVLGKMDLAEWQKKMEEVDLIFAMDSAALHLAATTSTPTFSLFGPSSMAIYKPPGDQHRALQGPCPYGIKFEDRCPRLRTCSTGSCLRSLTSEEIFTPLKQMLDRFLCLQKDDLLRKP